jgi:hypothetical protein
MEGPMRAVLAAALALPLFVDMLEKTAPESTTPILTFSSSRPNNDFEGSAVAIAERHAGKNCFKIFGACW